MSKTAFTISVVTGLAFWGLNATTVIAQDAAVAEVAPDTVEEAGLSDEALLKQPKYHGICGDRVGWRGGKDGWKGHKGMRRYIKYKGGSYRDIPCKCGDRVVSSTRLNWSDPVTRHRCHGPGLIVDRDYITLDCKYRTLKGWHLRKGPENFVKVGYNHAGITAKHKKKVTVRNCKVENFHNGIVFEHVRWGRIEKNRTNKNWGHGIHAVGLGDGNVKYNQSQWNGRAGIFVEKASNNRVERNNTRHNRGNGMVVWGGPKNKVSRNRNDYNYHSGLLVKGRHNAATFNSSFKNKGWGVCVEFDNLSLRNRGRWNGDGDVVRRPICRLDSNGPIT
jgi:parallel beta-helix repeat protein